MPRKPKPPPKISIGGAVVSRARALSDEQAFEAMGNRAAGESAEVKNSKAQTHGTCVQPRFRSRDKVEVRTTTVHLPVALLRAVNVLGAETDRSFTDITEKALTEYVERQRRAG
jgi:hypothetical protein